MTDAAKITHSITTTKEYSFTVDEAKAAWSRMNEDGKSIDYDEKDGWIHFKALSWPDGYCTYRAYEFKGTYRDALIDGLIRMGYLK